MFTPMNCMWVHFHNRSTHGRFEVVLGKVDGAVSFDSVYGKVLDIGSVSARALRVIRG